MPRNFRPGETFNALQFVDLPAGNKRKCSPGSSNPAGTPDPVHVILFIPGQVVIENHFDIIDIDTASGDIRCHQEFQAGSTKSIHYPVPLALVHAAVDPVG